MEDHRHKMRRKKLYVPSGKLLLRKKLELERHSTLKQLDQACRSTKVSTAAVEMKREQQQLE